MKIYLIPVLLLASFLSGFAQEFTWHDPLQTDELVLEGQGFDNIAYNRLPDDAEGKVRKPVWGLSRHAAGLLLRFQSDAAEIRIKYKPGGNLQMPHMPATGVSGLDLYTKDDTGKWIWVRGKYSFGKEVSYQFITPGSPEDGREYQLYLPLYNHVDSLMIGVEANDQFSFKAKRAEKPVVVYGTSIAQGACASRPGMAWTNIVGRELDQPIINLAFSGNGRLEPELIDYIKTIDAKIFVLDCLPNLGPGGGFTEEVVKAKIVNSVKSLNEQHPNTPILLVEHAGYSDGLVDPVRKKTYTDLNSWTEDIFYELKTQGFENLHLMTYEEIGMGNDDFVDGTHPTDLGMQHYAEAYLKKLRHILRE
ncbi:SGNH/GDSL hydrolase family protein [Echinicola salinicaeni]|uniref:SGNH/GDSL hydrolase family protein n=1 Tax=Echinicola salinicaeni TaxID=2762757 RepID=UPI0016458400|nr:SGNH/GDSL hydrolase family protein [Echinicola salinicaeni]